MLKMRVSGTKNDLKSFRKWIGRALEILPKYKMDRETEFKTNLKDGKYYCWEADLLNPLKEENISRNIGGQNLTMILRFR